MTTLSRIHDQAMEQAAKADLARMMGNGEEARVFIEEALKLERLAAEMTKDRLDLEPSRSVLFRSAASLALENGELREAERLAAMGLAGNPPDEIADELRDVLETANFHRHLELHGYKLAEEEFQISLSGDNVANGAVGIDEVMPRAENTLKLLYRTAQRRLGFPFKDRLPKELRQRFSPLMAVPRAASFAIVIRFAESTNQQCLPGLSLGLDIVDELLTCTEMFAHNQLTALKERMGQDAYYINFLKLTQRIAPDGERIKTVGFTASRNGTERIVALRIPKRDIDEIADQQAAVYSHAEPVVIVGKLLLANSLSPQHRISIRDAESNTHRVMVPEGLMDDIVRPLWNRKVRVTGSRTGKMISLNDIEQVQD